jgi:hypothetical protein
MYYHYYKQGTRALLWIPVHATGSNNHYRYSYGSCFLGWELVTVPGTRALYTVQWDSKSARDAGASTLFNLSIKILFLLVS